MILRSASFLAMVIASHLSSGQSPDTLVLIKERIIGRVTEVTPDQVAYKLPDDNVVHKIRKSDLVKISFGNGKSEQSPLANILVITAPEEWNKVKIVERQEDIQGVYKIDDIVVPGNMLTERGRNSLKMAAAMMGGNIVNVTDSKSFVSTGYVSYPAYSGTRNTTYVSHPYSQVYQQIIARVYSSQLPDSIAFRELMKQNPTLRLMTHITLRGRFRYKLVALDCQFADVKIATYSIEEGNIFVQARLLGVPVTKFHVNYFDNSRIMLSFRRRWNQKYHLLSLSFVPANISANLKH